MLRWTSSWSSDHAKVPAAISPRIAASPRLDVGQVMLAEDAGGASMRAWAIEPSMSASASRRSNRPTPV
jgi:hypothetical protein